MQHNLGIIGCGDFLRWQEPALKTGKEARVSKLFDTDAGRAKAYAAKVGGEPVASAEAVLADPAIDIVCLFVPPHFRKDLLLATVRAGKHILTTKPLGPSVAECLAMVKAVGGAKIKCGVMYGRTGNAGIETYKKIFQSGEIGRLDALQAGLDSPLSAMERLGYRPREERRPVHGRHDPQPEYCPVPHGATGGPRGLFLRQSLRRSSSATTPNS